VIFAATSFCIVSQRVFIVVSVYFVIDSVRKLLDISSYVTRGYQCSATGVTETSINEKHSVACSCFRRFLVRTSDERSDISKSLEICASCPRSLPPAPLSFHKSTQITLVNTTSTLHQETKQINEPVRLVSL